MTVEELIARLRTLPQDASVYFRREGSAIGEPIRDATFNELRRKVRLR